MEIPYTISTRPDTGLWNAKIGIWLFLASEVMLFGGLFSAYIFLRIDAAPGTIFGLFAGVYYWFPKATGRKMSEFWGKVHFWPTLICMNMIFLPMFLQGMAGMHRRWYDGGQGWGVANEHTVWGLTGFQWNQPISWAAWTMGLAQIPFIINFFWSIKHGEKVNDNPWEATTLEWTAPSPPPHGNFIHTPVAYRGPYEYSLPGRDRDFTMQNEPVEVAERTRRKPPAEPVPA